MFLSKKMMPVVLIVPAIAVLIVVAIYPLVFGVQLSLSSWKLGDPTGGRIFIGIKNYVNIFFSNAFWKSLRVTGIYTFIAVISELFLGLGIALLLNRDFRGKTIVRSMVIVPLAVTPVVVGLTWRVLYNTEYGIINYYLHALGLPSSNWIAGISTALISIVIVDIWQWTPFATLIILAGLHTIPQYLYEAAQIDGASDWKIFRFITLPYLKTSILTVLLFRTIDTFKAFDNIYSLTMGGPGDATESLSMHIYIQGFRNRHMGYASAMAIILLLIVTVISQLYIKYIAKSED